MYPTQEGRRARRGEMRSEAHLDTIESMTISLGPGAVTVSSSSLGFWERARGGGGEGEREEEWWELDSQRHCRVSGRGDDHPPPRRRRRHGVFPATKIG